MGERESGSEGTVCACVRVGEGGAGDGGPYVAARGHKLSPSLVGLLAGSGGGKGWTAHLEA